MRSKKKGESFWTGYSDLMTNLFFVMLMLFVMAIALLHKKVVATQEQLNKIEELNQSIENIDQDYFEYDSQFKRHTLKGIQASFNLYSSNIYDIEASQLKKLEGVGRSIVNFMRKAKETIPDAQYLLIVEGQSSKAPYIYNNELSYARALALINYWNVKGINFDSLDNCEVLIAGSGHSSRFRVEPDNRDNYRNQRFVIHIIPKPGTFDN